MFCHTILLWQTVSKWLIKCNQTLKWVNILLYLLHSLIITGLLIIKLRKNTGENFITKWSAIPSFLICNTFRLIDRWTSGKIIFTYISCFFTRNSKNFKLSDSNVISKCIYNFTWPFVVDQFRFRWNSSPFGPSDRDRERNRNQIRLDSSRVSPMLKNSVDRIDRIVSLELRHDHENEIKWLAILGDLVLNRPDTLSTCYRKPCHFGLVYKPAKVSSCANFGSPVIEKMKSILCVLAGLFVLAQAVQLPPDDDRTYLKKQKDIYELFWHVDQPTVYNAELYQKARKFNIAEHGNSYNDKVLPPLTF